MMRSPHSPILTLALYLAGSLGCANDKNQIEQPAPLAQVQESLPTGPYLGQPSPGREPELFAPGFVNTGLATRDLAMTPDGKELYFGVMAGGRAAILVTREVDGVWTPPEVAPFSGEYLDLEPAISPDGKTFMFLSTRPQEGQENKPGWVYQDIWVMDRVEDGWGEPYNLGPPVNTEAPEYYPSLTRDGTLYFTREGEGRVSHIYRSRRVDGIYQEPERLPKQVNSGASQFNAFVDPDEGFLIVPVMGREDSLGGVDYYVTFRSPEDTWSEPVNLGAPVSSENGQEWSASLSADGQYLFFMSARTAATTQEPWTGKSLEELLELSAQPGQGQSAIYWIDADVIRELAPTSEPIQEPTPP
jgi:hypothetical protein